MASGNSLLEGATPLLCCSILIRREIHGVEKSKLVDNDVQTEVSIRTALRVEVELHIVKFGMIKVASISILLVLSIGLEA